MAIKPSSDIVLDVLKAADPVRAQAATQRLSALGAGSVDSPDDFAKALNAAESAPADSPAPVISAANMRDQLPNLLSLSADQKAETKIEFEASILKSFVDEIMPKNETNVYGEGTAGDIWKSMLSDQIATQIAKSGAFGIAKQLFSTHPLPGAHSALASTAASDAALSHFDSAFRQGVSASRISNRS